MGVSNRGQSRPSVTGDSSLLRLVLFCPWAPQFEADLFGCSWTAGHTMSLIACRQWRLPSGLPSMRCSAKLWRRRGKNAHSAGCHRFFLDLFFCLGGGSSKPVLRQASWTVPHTASLMCCGIFILPSGVLSIRCREKRMARFRSLADHV